MRKVSRKVGVFHYYLYPSQNIFNMNNNGRRLRYYSSENEVAVVTLESGPNSRPSEYIPPQPKQL